MYMYYEIDIVVKCRVMNLMNKCIFNIFYIIWINMSFSCKNGILLSSLL